MDSDRDTEMMNEIWEVNKTRRVFAEFTQPFSNPSFQKIRLLFKIHHEVLYQVAFLCIFTVTFSKKSRNIETRVLTWKEIGKIW